LFIPDSRGAISRHQRVYMTGQRWRNGLNSAPKTARPLLSALSPAIRALTAKTDMCHNMFMTRAANMSLQRHQAFTARTAFSVCLCGRTKYTSRQWSVWRRRWLRNMTATIALSSSTYAALATGANGTPMGLREARCPRLMYRSSTSKYGQTHLTTLCLR